MLIEIYQKADALSKEHKKPVVLIFENMDQEPGVRSSGMCLHNPIQDYFNTNPLIFTIVTVHDWKNSSSGMQSRCPMVFFVTPGFFTRVGIIRKYCKEYGLILPGQLIYTFAAITSDQSGGELENTIKKTAEQVKNGTPLEKTEIYNQLERSFVIGIETAIFVISTAALLWYGYSGYIQDFIRHVISHMKRNGGNSSGVGKGTPGVGNSSANVGGAGTV